MISTISSFVTPFDLAIFIWASSCGNNPEDIKWVKFLLHLKGTGMSINDLKQYVTWRAEGDSTIPNRLELLKQTRTDFMDQYRQVQHHLQILNDKINWYQAKESGIDTGQEPFANYLKRIGHEE